MYIEARSNFSCSALNIVDEYFFATVICVVPVLAQIQWIFPVHLLCATTKVMEGRRLTEHVHKRDKNNVQQLVGIEDHKRYG